METLKNKIMEALTNLTQPMVNNGEVKVIALQTNDYIDSNLALIQGMNRACLIWTPEDGNGYICANGGISFNDGQEWRSIKDIEKIIGKQKWEDLGKESLKYSYASSIGESPKYQLNIYSTTIKKSELDKIYQQYGKTLSFYRRRYATTKLKQIITGWKSQGYLYK